MGATGFARAGGVETVMPPLVGTTCRLGTRKIVHTDQDPQGTGLKPSVFNALGLACPVEIRLAPAMPMAPGEGMPPDAATMGLGGSIEGQSRGRTRRRRRLGKDDYGFRRINIDQVEISITPTPRAND